MDSEFSHFNFGPNMLFQTLLNKMGYKPKSKDQKFWEMYVRDIAEEILDQDSVLETEINRILAKQLKKISNKKVDFSVIS